LQTTEEEEITEDDKGGGERGVRREGISQCLIQILIHFHDCSLIPTTITIIWGREDGDNIHHMRPIVSLRVGSGGGGEGE
jgi:hypothetical protein